MNRAKGWRMPWINAGHLWEAKYRVVDTPPARHGVLLSRKRLLAKRKRLAMEATQRARQRDPLSLMSYLARFAAMRPLRG